jgi:hypothetical protein
MIRNVSGASVAHRAERKKMCVALHADLFILGAVADNLFTYHPYRSIILSAISLLLANE